MMNQIILLIGFFSVSCIDNNKRANTGPYYAIAEDSTKIINDIKKQYTEINANASSYSKVEIDILGQSSEGGVILAYYDNADLKKITVTYYGEMGNNMSEYYFNQSGLFFGIRRDYFYDKPIYEEGFKVASIEENRYYFYNQTLFKWIDKNKQSVSPDSKEYPKENKYLLKEIENFTKKLEDYNLNYNKALPADTVLGRY